MARLMSVAVVLLSVFLTTQAVTAQQGVADEDQPPSIEEARARFQAMQDEMMTTVNVR